MTRWGDLLHFGHLFKACDNKYFPLFLGNFFHFYIEIILGNFIDIWVHFICHTGSISMTETQ